MNPSATLVTVDDRPRNLGLYWASWNRSEPASGSGIARFFYDLRELPGGRPVTYYYEVSAGQQMHEVWLELIALGFSQPVRTAPLQVPVLTDPGTLEPCGLARADGSLIVPLQPADA